MRGEHKLCRNLTSNHDTTSYNQIFLRTLSRPWNAQKSTSFRRTTTHHRGPRPRTKHCCTCSDTYSTHTTQRTDRFHPLFAFNLASIEKRPYSKMACHKLHETH